MTGRELFDTMLILAILLLDCGTAYMLWRNHKAMKNLATARAAFLAELDAAKETLIKGQMMGIVMGEFQRMQPNDQDGERPQGRLH